MKIDEQQKLKLIQALGFLFDEIEVESDEEADRILEAAGYNPKLVGNKFQALVESALAEMRWERDGIAHPAYDNKWHMDYWKEDYLAAGGIVPGEDSS